MEAIDLSLIIQHFKLDNVFTKGKVGFFETCDGNRTLVDHPNAENKPAEVFIILLREDAIEDTRPKAIDV